MRVLHTDFLRGWGGEPYRIIMDAAECQALGAKIMIAAPENSELGRRAPLRDLQTDTTISFKNGLRFRHISDIFRLRKIINEFQPDILHLHGGKDSWLAAKVLTLLPPRKRPIVVRTKHNLFPVRDNFMNRWLYHDFFDWLIAISTPVESSLASMPFIDGQKICVIPDTYDNTRFTTTPLTPEERHSIRASFGFGDNDFLCTTVARFEKEKGLDILIKAARLALDKDPNLRFLLVGDGRLKNELTNEVAALKLNSDQFVFAGFREDIPQLFKASNVAIVPSRSEGMGTVAIEAGICGIPVIAARCGGLVDVIKHELNGLLFETENADALAQAVLHLSQEPDKCATMGRFAVDFINRHFSPTALGHRTIAFYEQILSQR